MEHVTTVLIADSADDFCTALTAALQHADGFQVVVLTAGAHTFLHRRRTMVVAAFQPQENILELVHPSVRKKKRRVIIWH